MKFVINLIKTPQGYSLIEGEVEVNRSTSKNTKEKSYSLSKSTALSIQSLPNKILRYTRTYPARTLTTINTSSSQQGPSGST